jgi:tetratricopeptide (TPR) repeat protein
MDAAALSALPYQGKELDEEISRLQLVLMSCWEEEERMSNLGDLISYLDQRYVQRLVIDDRKLAIVYSYEVLAYTPTTDRRRLVCILTLLGMLHSVMINQTDLPSLNDVDEALSLGDEALDLSGGQHDTRSHMRLLLYVSDFRAMRYRIRHTALDALDDLNCAIALAELAVQKQPRDSRAVFTAVQYLLKRYERVGDYWDVELAVRYAEEACVGAIDDYKLLVCLCDALQSRYTATRHHGDLDEAIQRLKEALRFTSIPDAARRALMLQLEMLEDVHTDRFQGAAQCTDQELELTIRQLEESLLLLRSQESPIPCRLLIQLANRYLVKTNRNSTEDDLNVAKQCLQEAIMAVPRGHPYVNELICKLGAVWKQLGDSSELEERRQYCYYWAHKTYMVAAEGTSQSTVERIQAYRGAAEFPLLVGDWSLAARYLKSATELLPLIAPHSLSLEDLEFVLPHVAGLSSLAAATLLSAGMECAHNALATMELGRGVISGLITCTRINVSGLEEKNPELHAEYMGVRRGVSATANPVGIVPMEEILGAIAAAGIELPKVGRGGWKIDANEGTRKVPGLSNHLMVTHNPTNAGTQDGGETPSTSTPRSYSTVLDTTHSSPAYDQSSSHPNLRISQDATGKILVEILGNADNTRLLNGVAPGIAISVHQEFAAQLARVEERIRRTEGFDKFQERSTLDYFRKIGANGPVVAFNVTFQRSDAFIVTKEGVHLKSFSQKALGYDLVQEKAKVLTGPECAIVEREDGPDQSQRNAELRKVLKWLWDAAIKPILEELDLLQTTTVENCSELPRIWWVTSGILGLFPIHAAGHTWGDSLENTMSHVVSSYIPTIKALEYAREKAANATPPQDCKALIVAMKETTGKEPLDIDEEILLVKKFTACQPLISPRKAAVMRGLRDSNIAHFACHGEADPVHPRKSTLYIADGEDNKPEKITVEDLATVDLPNAQLAYLSACSTAENKVMQLAEENLHMAAAFQLIGFPQVIGTLWEAKDWAARKVASKFYNQVNVEMANGWQHSDKYALFLHQAVTETRREGLGNRPNRTARDNVLAWVPFVHIGC